MPEIKETDWAYAAGFVDGEGCIAITRSFSPQRNRFYYGVAVVVSNRDRSVLDWFKEVWDGHVLLFSPDRGGKAVPAWNWRSLTGANSWPFLSGIRPYLRIKSAQCTNALAMAVLLRRSSYTLGRRTLPEAWLREQEEMYWVQRELNHRGSDPFVRKAIHSPRKIHRERQNYRELA